MFTMADKNSAWRNPWVIAWVLMVVVFFTMNLIMIFMATGNKPGLVVDDYYERGQDYEKNLLKRLARDPGWKMEVKLPRKIEVDEPVICRYTVRDKAGQPVTPDSVTFYAYRPSDARRDFSVPMHQVEPGLYEAEIRFPLFGAWDTLVSAKQGEDEYHTPKRIGVGMDWVP
jgi:nitrogen fixation protein FixH